MTKADELRDPKSCLNSAEADEPLFVLRANDYLAPMAIRHWVSMSIGVHEKEKLDEAMELADSMEHWKKQKHQQPTEAT